MNPPSILVVRFSAIGDCVMAVPTAAAFRRAHPQARIGWVVEERCAPVVDSATLVDVLAEYPRQRWKARAWSVGTWREQLAFYAKLRRQRFDFGLDLQGHSKTAICLRLATPKRRLAARGTDPLARRLNPIAQIPDGIVHTVERNLEALFELTGIRGAAEFRMPDVLGEVDIGRDGRLATIGVGGGQPEKRYPTACWGEVAKGLLERGWRVAFLGGPGEDAPPVESASNLVGKTSLRETMAWIAASDLHLAADTGTGHLAAAYGVPVVSVFGPTDPAVFRPYSERARVLRRGTNPSEVPVSDILHAVAELVEGDVRAVSD